MGGAAKKSEGSGDGMSLICTMGAFASHTTKFSLLAHVWNNSFLFNFILFFLWQLKL